MALIVADRVQETTTTSGTGTVTLAGAVDGFQPFAVIGDGNTTYYCIVNNNDWEVGIGTYTASGTTLSRDTILDSSNAGSAVDLIGDSNVFVTYPADKSVDTDGAQTLINKTLTNPTINGFTGNTDVINIGSGQIYKDASGNVGIGTSSPSGKLDVRNGANTSGTGAWLAKVHQNSNDSDSNGLSVMNTRSAPTSKIVEFACAWNGSSFGYYPIFYIDGVNQRFSAIYGTGGTASGGTVYPEFQCRAWVNFNGTGTVAIRASGNVSSITDNGTGDYTVNFTTAMPDADYSVCSTNMPINSASDTRVVSTMIRGVYNTGATTMTTTALRIQTAGIGAIFQPLDTNIVCISIFR